MDIVNILQKEVDRLTKEEYGNDECPPEFIVSVMYDGSPHKILLTVRHLGQSFTDVLFPNEDYKYGYESLSKEMEYLYNRTM